MFKFEDFIKKSNIIHNNKYCYDNCVFKNKTTKIFIKCFIHGDFLQRPSDHIRGRGCPKCAQDSRIKKRLLTKKECIARFINKFGDHYIYNKVNYIDSRTPVIIICKKHGEFKQKPYLHWQGYGCRKCAKNDPLNTNTCIDKFIQTHNNLYIYDKVVYVSYHKKVKIICKKHGVFNQTPANHIKGKGCSSCSKNKILSTNECINLFKNVWKDTFIYDKFKYSRSYIKSIIICKKHGEFKQTPNNHMSGHGCRKCNNIVSKKETKWLDSLGIKKENRQISLPGLSKKIKVDGYDPDTNTVYEFYGDYWHGNLKKFNYLDINKTINLSFNTLFEKTMEKEKNIKCAGYDIVSIWESDFDKQYKV